MIFMTMKKYNRYYIYMKSINVNLSDPPEISHSPSIENDHDNYIRVGEGRLTATGHAGCLTSRFPQDVHQRSRAFIALALLM